MIAVIKGDIVNSRIIANQNKWLTPLKKLFNKFGRSPKRWEIVWGDFFQIEISDPPEALRAALEIKALIKSIDLKKIDKKSSPIDVRMAIGIGDKEYSGRRISESNGTAFVFSGEKFEKLKKEKSTLALQTPWEEFNEEMNLCLKLASVFMDKWTISSGELIKFILQNKNATQEEIGEFLGIKQNSVSGRWNRANASEVLELLKFYEDRLFRRLI
ncbi:MAG: hypothetical protein GXO87_10025 [Chlorobi bacterium]|nr:hypothetical protein [Chlorobiota bacterium]